MDKINILEKIRTNKKLQRIVLIVIICILALVLLFSFIDTGKKEVATSEIESYVSSLENKLIDTLSEVKGAGKVSVVINVESGKETIIAKKTTIKESESGKITEDTPVLVNGKVVVLKEMFPKIIGVLIVAEGADDYRVNYLIQEATVSLLNINVNQIEILKMK